MKKYVFLPLVFLTFNVCAQQKAELVVFNAKVYTVDNNFSTATAIAVNDGKIVEVGSSAALQKKYKAAKSLDAKGKYIFPGFIDAHAHFLEYGLGLNAADLVGTKSWTDIIDRLKIYASSHKEGWIVGNGWDQNDWADKNFPDNAQLNILFPDRPVILSRVDGHAAIANDKALEISHILAGDTLIGGTVEVKNGKLTGILVDNATGLVYKNVPNPSLPQIISALLAAQKNCFAAGLTTIDDCGENYMTALLMKSLQDSKKLKMRLFVMLSDRKENYEYLFAKGKIKTDRMNISSFKVFADGALGSRGACLLSPYSDRAGWEGFLLSSQAHFDSVANIIYDHGFQMCTHAIGDSANRTILKIYDKYLKGKNDRRWRIEHSQVINENDFHYFKNNSIVPSVQPTHATSDMYWAGDRLGKERLKNAYANQRLLKQNGWLPLGTDFPVEDISPIKTFYAAVFRKDANHFPPNGFQMENALTREQAIRGMTIWAAKSNFEENEKGSIEKGKFADFILLDTDLLKAPENQILKTKVLATYVNGEKVF
ncbi:MAG: amidohydrolase [Ginsengibacter sp.]